MKKIIPITFIFFLVSNCSVPGSALLGPIFTGAKTGSVYQASLSYGSNKIMTKIINDENDKKRLNKDTSSKISFNDDQIIIVSTFAVEKVVFSEVTEPEPLP
tara:strand:- start:80 stop:385 length:306 start_codon:yes stop_codon:yes gene_type:complete